LVGSLKIPIIVEDKDIYTRRSAEPRPDRRIFAGAPTSWFKGWQNALGGGNVGPQAIRGQ
jgi:hypothetical protein